MSDYDEIDSVDLSLSDITNSDLTESEDEEEEESKFHFCAIKVFLTYSQANYLTFDILKKWLLNNNVAIWIFAQEDHKLPESDCETDDEIDDSDNNSVFSLESEESEGNRSMDFDEFVNNQENSTDDEEEDEEEKNSAGIHFHCLIQYISKVEFRNHDYYDITTTTPEGHEITYHPNIGYCRSWRASSIYVKKEGNWQSNENQMYDHVQSLQTKSQFLKFIYEWNLTHKMRYWEEVWKDRPKLTYFDDRTELPFFRWFFSVPKWDFKKGFNTTGSRGKALYLVGGPETGKTLWVSQFLGTKEPILYVGDWKQFSLYKNEKIIVMEDFDSKNFQNMTSFMKSLITDRYIDLYTPSYYQSHLLNRERIIIFTSNTDPRTDKFFDTALLSRLVIIDTNYELVDTDKIQENFNRIFEKYSLKSSINEFIHTFHSYCKGTLNTITEDEKKIEN